MIQRIVAGALRMPFVVFAARSSLIVIGLAAYKQLDIEAYPNPVPPLVEVITQPTGWSAEEMERYVTIPLEIGLAGMQGLDAHPLAVALRPQRRQVLLHLGARDYKDARQEVINRLAVRARCRPACRRQLSPWNAIGEVFRYRVVGKGYTAQAT